MSDKKKTNNTGSYLAFVFLIVFAIIIANYSYDEAVNDGLKYYWNYAFMSLILEGIIVGTMLLSCCCIICAAVKENETCVKIILYATNIIICLCIIANSVFMYIIINNNIEVTKFKLIANGEYQVMLQIACSIQCYIIFIMTMRIIGYACYYTVKKCSSVNDTQTSTAEINRQTVIQSPENNV